MKKINIVIICTFCFSLFFGCKKIDVPNTNTVSVSLIPKASTYITENVTLAPNTAFGLNFTITCPTEMEFVYVSKNGTLVTTDQLTTNKTTFTADKSLVADAAPGVYTYRIWAKDKAGVYLGERNIVVTVTGDFWYYTNQQIYVPDASKALGAYYSSSTNQIFSYNGVGTKSNLIDFGYFWDPILTGTPAVANGHTIYALNISPAPSQIAVYDITSFTKNATVMKRITTPAFATGINSSTVLQTIGVANLGSGTSTSINKLTTGTLVLFRTAAGKYGVLSVNYTNRDDLNAGTFMNFDIKIQK